MYTLRYTKKNSGQDAIFQILLVFTNKSKTFHDKLLQALNSEVPF